MRFTCRTSGSVDFKSGRCTGSKAMHFKTAESFATVSNVNIAICNFTIAFWTRSFSYWHYRSEISFIRGSSTRGKISIYKFILARVQYTVVGFKIELEVSRSRTSILHVNIPGNKVRNWNHFSVTNQQCDKVKTYVNGTLCLKRGKHPDFTDHCSEFRPYPSTRPLSIRSIPRPSKKTYNIGSRDVIIQELHILGFALPPHQIYTLHKGQQTVKMNYSFCS